MFHKVFSIKPPFCILFLLLCCSAPFFAADGAAAGEKTVIIENARKTEYRKDPETGNELIFLTGNVSLSVTEGSSKSVISAEEVTFDRKREMVYARGNVSLKRYISGKASETLSGESLLFNIATLEGIFENSSIIQNEAAEKNTQENSSVIISADVFGRDSSGTTSFKTGTLTFCDEPEPHWRIKASRIWLLPGNEFSFLNAVLYAGQIPVFYFPFFYFPKDEMIFNPVFGYRTREGYFTQTTTYLIGRKPQENNSDEAVFLSLTSSGGPPKEQRREGLFLRNLDTDLASVPKNTLKIVADLYSNLGGLLGVSGEFVPEKNPIRKIGFTTNIGFSRNLYPVSGVYVPYDSNGKTHWNSSSLFGFTIPFRYELGFTLDISVHKFSMSLAFPLYSDPFFKTDFFDRKETMDWLAFLTENPSAAEDITNSTDISSFLWKLNGSFRPEVKSLNPYITKSEISSFTSSISFSSRNDTTLPAALQTVSPERKFFFPTAIVPLNTELQIAGTLFSYPPPPPAVVQKKETELPPLSPPGDLQKPPEAEPGDTAVQTPGLTAAYFGDFFPAMSPSVPNPVSLSGITYNLNYSLSPKFVSELDYSSLYWNSSSDIKWDEFSSTYYKISSLASLDSQLKWKDNFISLTNKLQFFLAYAEHPEISSKYYTDAQKAQTILNDFAARKSDMDLSSSLSLQPFYLTKYFKDFSLSWNWKLKLLRNSFTGTADTPEWTALPPSWDEKSFDTHNIVLFLSTSIRDITPSFTLTSTLPPLKDSYTGKFTLAFPAGSFSINTGIVRRDIASQIWDADPLNVKVGFKFFEKTLTTDHSFTYNIKDGFPSDYTGDIRWTKAGLSLVFSMAYTIPYTLDETTGWMPETEQRFMPKNLIFKFDPEKSTLYSWKNRISLLPGLSTSLAYDIIRPTESYFIFSPSITFRINDFLDITFSSESRNDVVFRYIQKAAGFSPQIPGETNIFADLLNSFSFWDTQKRQEAGFKLKSLSVKLEHNLHDWVLKTEFTIKPRLITDTVPYRYDFSPYFTFGISWKPFKGMKTTIADEYGKFILNP